MKINSFSFNDTDEEGTGWVVSPFTLNDHINLFVGESGSGKTRVLNILFNLGAFVANSNRFCGGNWRMEFSHSDQHFIWEYSGYLDREKVPRISNETLLVKNPNGDLETLISRDADHLVFGDAPVPRLSGKTSALHLFKEEDAIKPAYDAFASIMRRSFFGDDLTTAVSLQSLPRSLNKKLDAIESADKLWGMQLGLHVLLFLLKEKFPKKFDVITDQFKRVFPFVEDFTFAHWDDYVALPFQGEAPLLQIKEKKVQRPVPLQELSSGMQKVLLIIADVVIAPAGVLYMIDEYENSLGVNAIDFLPPFLAECGAEKQFILTSHHPALINAIPVDEWLVFHRRGSEIKIRNGSVLAEKYGRSKQQRFIQLLNDPFFSDGVE